MNTHFIDFWHLYAPQKEFHNRFIACKKLWETMDDKVCKSILKELAKERSSEMIPKAKLKNPYFFLLDWQPPQPQWLTPNEVWSLLNQHVPLAVCLNPRTGTYGTVTKEDAEQYELQVHHYM